MLQRPLTCTCKQGITSASSWTLLSCAPVLCRSGQLRLRQLCCGHPGGVPAATQAASTEHPVGPGCGCGLCGRDHEGKPTLIYPFSLQGEVDKLPDKLASMLAICMLGAITKGLSSQGSLLRSAVHGELTC